MDDSLEQPSALRYVETRTTTGEQTQNKISDERLAEIINLLPIYAPDPSSAEIVAMAGELLQERRDLEAMTEDRNLWKEAHDDDCPNKVRLQEVEVELTALRASHKRLVDVLEEIERHHLELNRAEGRPANHSHTLRLCAAALAEARKLEDK